MSATIVAPGVTKSPVYSDEQLRHAWQQCRLQAWPASFEATMADPTRARLVRLHAGLLARRFMRVAQAAVRRGPTPSPAVPHAHPPGYIDHKRAAAGDRDD